MLYLVVHHLSAIIQPIGLFQKINDEEGKVLFLELGVGANTPGIIKYPFWRMTAQNPNAIYVCIIFGEAIVPKEISTRSIGITEDIGKVLDVLISP